MTREVYAHTHTTFVRGCFRCHLGQVESDWDRSNPRMTFVNATLRPANAPGAFILDNDGDEQLLFVEDLNHLRNLIDQLLPRTPHNHDATDPDAHVLFASVCCGAQLYRCSGFPGQSIEFDEGLPSKPIIAQGETSCRNCGADLAQF